MQPLPNSTTASSSSCAHNHTIHYIIVLREYSILALHSKTTYGFCNLCRPNYANKQNRNWRLSNLHQPSFATVCTIIGYRSSVLAFFYVHRPPESLFPIVGTHWYSANCILLSPTQKTKMFVISTSTFGPPWCFWYVHQTLTSTILREYLPVRATSHV